VGDYVFRVCDDGIWAWNGTEDVKVSKHIDTDFQPLTKTDACAVNYQNEYWVSFPTDGITLTCDPDTIRRDDVGDFRVSWYRFNNYGVNHFIYHSESEDNGFLLAIKNVASPYLVRCDNGTADGTTAITQTVHTPYVLDDGEIKHFKRLKTVFDEVATTTAQAHSIVLASDDGDRTVSTTFTVTVGTDVWSNDLALPQSLDGRNLQMRIVHSSKASTRLKSFHIQTDKRRF
jgi:hypothetical protein